MSAMGLLHLPSPTDGVNRHPHVSPTCPFGRFPGTCTYQLHFFVVVVTWCRLPLGVGLCLLVRLRRCGGLLLPGVPHICPGLRGSARGWCKWWCMVAELLRQQAFTHLSYFSFSADGLHRPLHTSATCPFRRMVGTGLCTSLLLVLFGGCSAQAFTRVSYLSFSDNGADLAVLQPPSTPQCPRP